MSQTPKPEARKVRRMSRQVVVALPRWARRRLGVEPGALVYWARHRAGEVVLSAKQDRRAGAPGRHDLEEELAQVTAERDEYKRQALGLELGERRAVFAQGYEASLKQEIPIRAQLVLLREQLAEVLAHVRPTRRVHQATTGARRRSAAARASHPRPDPSPPSSSGGDEASGGEAPQASHLELTPQGP